MPYIPKRDRESLLPPCTPGQLNYAISMVIKKYFEANSNYTGINDIIGALEGAKLEFYRRIVVPYEDAKIQENGDIYG